MSNNDKITGMDYFYIGLILFYLAFAIYNVYMGAEISAWCNIIATIICLSALINSRWTRRKIHDLRMSHEYDSGTRKFLISPISFFLHLKAKKNDMYLPYARYTMLYKDAENNELLFIILRKFKVQALIIDYESIDVMNNDPANIKEIVDLAETEIGDIDEILFPINVSKNLSSHFERNQKSIFDGYFDVFVAYKNKK